MNDEQMRRGLEESRIEEYALLKEYTENLLRNPGQYAPWMAKALGHSAKIEAVRRLVGATHEQALDICRQEIFRYAESVPHGSLETSNLFDAELVKAFSHYYRMLGGRSDVY